MRIATYNIWNTDVGMPERMQSILTQIKLVNADILCLQEVKDGNFYEHLLEKRKTHIQNLLQVIIGECFVI